MKCWAAAGLLKFSLKTYHHRDLGILAVLRHVMCGGVAEMFADVLPGAEGEVQAGGRPPQE